MIQTSSHTDFQDPSARYHRLQRCQQYLCQRYAVATGNKGPGNAAHVALGTTGQSFEVRILGEQFEELDPKRQDYTFNAVVSACAKANRETLGCKTTNKDQEGNPCKCLSVQFCLLNSCRSDGWIEAFADFGLALFWHLPVFLKGHRFISNSTGSLSVCLLASFVRPSLKPPPTTPSRCPCSR